jgi:hypothetical protein
VTNATDITQTALEVLRMCSSGEGFLASSNSSDNYKRVWSRDAMIAGIACAVSGNHEFRKEFLASIETLASMRSELGQIPSNVTLGAERRCSFGTLSGRVDATSWWLCGVGVYACIYGTEDVIKFRESISRSFQLLKTWEMNGRDFIFTPPGGNWADEYLVQGHTLYDQCLRLWAMYTLGKAFNLEDMQAEYDRLRVLIKNNYSFFGSASAALYHPVAYERWRLLQKPYMAAQFDASGYAAFWDEAGNALALVLGINEYAKETSQFIGTLRHGNPTALPPAFSPTIEHEDSDWLRLESHFAYTFKNEPGEFHNGGVWPVWCGWLALGLSLNQERFVAEHIQQQLAAKLTHATPQEFKEYWSSKTGLPGGVGCMAFTASGWLLAQAALQVNTNEIKQVLPW